MYIVYITAITHCSEKNMATLHSLNIEVDLLVSLASSSLSRSSCDGPPKSRSPRTIQVLLPWMVPQTKYCCYHRSLTIHVWLRIYAATDGPPGLYLRRHKSVVPLTIIRESFVLIVKGLCGDSYNWCCDQSVRCWGTELLGIISWNCLPSIILILIKYKVPCKACMSAI